MTNLEHQLSDLLHRAPGEPPRDLNADLIVADVPRRRRRAASAAAAVVIAVAVAAAIGVASGVTRPDRPATQPPAPASTRPAPSDPQSSAKAAIDEAMRTAPLPPGAQRATHQLPVVGSVSTSTSPNEVRRTTWWTAPGTLTAVGDFVSRHRPAGMGIESTGRAVGKGGSLASLNFDFETKAPPGRYGLDLDYDVSPYHSGVAIRIDTWTVWAPIRPQWSYAPADPTTVEVTVVRRPFKNTTGGLGAPTIRRTLTGAHARDLATAINTIISVAPEGPHSCPPPLLDATDTVVVHTTTGDLVFTETGSGCSPNTVVTDPRNPKTVTYIFGAAFETAVLKSLGLPGNYGDG